MVTDNRQLNLRPAISVSGLNYKGADACHKKVLAARALLDWHGCRGVYILLKQKVQQKQRQGVSMKSLFLSFTFASCDNGGSDPKSISENSISEGA